VRRHVPASDLSSLPNRPGAYVITVRTGKRYVGSSKTLRSRVLAHRDSKDPHVTEPIGWVCAYLTRSHMDARLLEAWLIREVRPELNRSCLLPGGTSRCGRDCEEWTAPRTIVIAVRLAEVTGELAPAGAAVLPEAPGAYVLTTASGKQYVGSSRVLRHRVAAHLRASRDRNVTEAVRSIRCYVTAEAADAAIVEYWLVRGLEPELNRENQPDASTWKSGSLGALLDGTSPDLCAAVEALRTRMCTLPGVKEVVRRTWITYQLSPLKNFCAVKVLTTSLQVDLKLPAACVTDAAGVSSTIKPTQAWNFDRRIEVTLAGEIEAAWTLVRQAYLLMKR